MRLLVFFCVYAVVQAILVRWLLQRPNPIWIRIGLLIPALALPPATLCFLITFSSDPFAIFWVYSAMAGAITGFIVGVFWHLAAPWFEVS